MNGNKWQMAGTESTFEYVVLVVAALARIGVRALSGKSRVRIEPTGDTVEQLASEFPASIWKQPGQGGQNRWSAVPSSADTESVVRSALATLIAGGGVEVNPDLSASDLELVRSSLVSRVKQLKLPGCNAASTWGTAALLGKVNGAAQS